MLRRFAGLEPLPFWPMGSMVEFASNGSTANGYLATPEGGSGPGVVVIQEWWGLVPHIREVADRFAAEGFVALAPDLYHGASTTEPDEAGKLLMALKIDDAAKDLEGAVALLRAHPSATGKVGVVGFCMGGALTLALAGRGVVDAAVPFYGPPDLYPGFDDIRVPLLAHYASDDGWADPEKARAAFDRLAATGVEVIFHVYPGTDHAFFNDHRPEVYHSEAAALAWSRTIAFFNNKLT